jgi:hypothetical protein
MPCALTEPSNYPDYLKKILKEIAVGDDDTLKACACSLRSPTTEDGCLIVDEDKKVGAFPFCCQLTTDDPLEIVAGGEYWFYSIKLTLRQMMKLYWNTKKATSMTYRNGPCGPPIPFSASCGEVYSDVQEPKKRVCSTGISFSIAAINNYTHQCNPENNGGIFSLFIGSYGGYPSCYMRKEGEEYFFYPSMGSLFGITQSSVQRYYPGRSSNGVIEMQIPGEDKISINTYQPSEDNCCIPNCPPNSITKGLVLVNPIKINIELFS